MTSGPRVAPRRSLVARAILFVAVSAFAVPACQHFEGDGSHDSTQARGHRPAPAEPQNERAPRVELKLDAYS